MPLLSKEELALSVADTSYGNFSTTDYSNDVVSVRIHAGTVIIAIWGYDDKRNLILKNNNNSVVIMPESDFVNLALTEWEPEV